MSDKITILKTRSAADILAARRIRREVFAEEQGIPAHLDSDGLDEAAFHVLCRVDDEVVGTGRLVPTDDTHGVLARIAVRARFRGLGLGRLIVQELESIAIDEQLVSLSLQPHKHLEQFYQSLGYYRVPGIDFVADHELITMRKELGAKPTNMGR